MSDIVFLDTETLGLDPDAPVWEFAAVRRFADPESAGHFGSLKYGPHGAEADVCFTIQHDPKGWVDGFPAEFAADYHARYDETTAWCERAAAHEIDAFTRGAHIIGAVPSFDTERLAKLLRRNGMEPSWHYHLIDVENIVVGWLHGVAARAIDEAREWGEEPDPALLERRLDPPWKSEQLSRAIGIDPDDYARHTAMGDVLWTKAQWDTVIGASA
jgi:hypothetical protein